jgi:predicted metal-dependent hydrolase
MSDIESLTPDERLRLMKAGRAAFNRGEFYEAHEHWEDVWNVIDEPERTWVQGLIQIATGLHKLQRELPSVCATLLRKALVKLADAPERLDGLEVLRLRRDAERILAEIERGERPNPALVRLERTDA